MKQCTFMILEALVIFGIGQSIKKDGLIDSALESSWQIPEKVNVIVVSGLFKTGSNIYPQ